MYSISLFILSLLAVNSRCLAERRALRDASQSDHPINPPVSEALFKDLEELSRIVDISYCVGLTGTGIQKPFTCVSRCRNFENFELVTTWNTGQLMSDSCGYIALSHGPEPRRIIVAFRGTYSLANTIADLSTIPQAYMPYPGEDGEDDSDSEEDLLSRPQVPLEQSSEEDSRGRGKACANCTVHMGFMTSWRHARPHVMAPVEKLVQQYPDYRLTLVGHSLGGAVAALAAMDFYTRGWQPQITTVGEPKIGNQEMVRYLDNLFATGSSDNISNIYRRVTHVNDPIPLLPLTEWGYRSHGGEIYISKNDLPPAQADLYHCKGDADLNCISGADSSVQALQSPVKQERDDAMSVEGLRDWWNNTRNDLVVPARWRIWQIFFAHRDYFWRLGLCLPNTASPKDSISTPDADLVENSPEDETTEL